jgi:hypothetical protein
MSAVEVVTSAKKQQNDCKNEDSLPIHDLPRQQVRQQIGNYLRKENKYKDHDG